MHTRGRRRRRRVLPSLAVFGTWFAGALVFFREQWTTGFKNLMGNDGDARLEAYLCEHWFQVFHGRGSWLNPAFFYPVRYLLGWSDTFLIYEVFYAPLRLMGCGPSLALQITVIILSLVGLASFVALARMLFSVPWLIVLPLSLVFTFSNTLWLHAGAYQDSGLYLVPAVGVLLVGSWRAASSGKRRRSMVLGASGGILGALLLYSTYYVGYFSLLIAVVAAVVSVLSRPRRTWKWVRSVLGTAGPAVILTAIGFVVGLVPFAATYLPARSDSPGSTYAETMDYAASVHDLANFGHDNVLWSHLVQQVFPHINYQAYEIDYAVTPVVMLATLAGGALCGWWLFSGRAAVPFAARFAVTAAVTAVITELLPLHTRFGTPWAVIYHLPGASAMRSIDRIQLIAWFVALSALAAASVEVLAHAHGRRSVSVRALLAVVMVLALSEQINTFASSTISRRAQDVLLASTPPAPRGCSNFFVVDLKEPGIAFFESQIDAMLISQRLGLPTLNGYTAYNPPGWSLGVVGSPTYLASVRRWIALEHITGQTCELDLGTMRWVAANPL